MSRMDKLDFNLFMDLHNHTIWSDGADKPEDIILNAINHKVEAVGITDHFCHDYNRSLGFEKINFYLNKIGRFKTKYCNEIKVFIGIEIAYSYLLKNYKVLPYDKLNQLDFILLENLDYIPATTNLEDVADLLNEFKCTRGLAHTDLVKLSGKYGKKGGMDYVLEFVKQGNLFWEINIDSAHDVFFNILHSGRKDEETEALIDGIIKRKIPVSVGSDTHSLVQYDYGRLIAANEVAKSLNKAN